MERSPAFRRLDNIAAGAIVKRRQYHDIHLVFKDIQGLDHGERVHANGQVLAMIFKHAQWQHHRPILRNGCSDLVRQHQFKAH